MNFIVHILKTDGTNSESTAAPPEPARKRIRLNKGDLPLWMLGLAFTVLGLIMAGEGMKLYQFQSKWTDAVNTTGRVIITEWKQIGNENSLVIRYAYKDAEGTIYHNTGTLPRKLGKLNLEPASPVVVAFRPEDHSRSILQMELGGQDWIALLVLGLIEVFAGCFFIVACIRRAMTRQE